MEQHNEDIGTREDLARHRLQTERQRKFVMQLYFSPVPGTGDFSMCFSMWQEIPVTQNAP